MRVSGRTLQRLQGLDTSSGHLRCRPRVLHQPQRQDDVVEEARDAQTTRASRGPIAARRAARSGASCSAGRAGAARSRLGCARARRQGRRGARPPCVGRGGRTNPGRRRCPTGRWCRWWRWWRCWRWCRWCRWWRWWPRPGPAADGRRPACWCRGPVGRAAAARLGRRRRRRRLRRLRRRRRVWRFRRRVGGATAAEPAAATFASSACAAAAAGPGRDGAAGRCGSGRVVTFE